MITKNMNKYNPMSVSTNRNPNTYVKTTIPPMICKIYAICISYLTIAKH